MDAEMREAFGKLDMKMDGIRADLAKHLVESAKHEERLNGQGKALDKHIKEHCDRKKWWWSLWLTAITGIAVHAWKWFSGNGHGH